MGNLHLTTKRECDHKLNFFTAKGKICIIMRRKFNCLHGDVPTNIAVYVTKYAIFSAGSFYSNLSFKTVWSIG